MLNKIINWFKKEKDMEILKMEGKFDLNDTIAIENNRDVLNFMVGDINRSIRLTSYIKNNLTNLFGKHNQRFKGNYYYYVWVFKFNDDLFHVYTAPNKGTQICVSKTVNAKTCIEFLKQLDKKLMNNE